MAAVITSLTVRGLKHSDGVWNISPCHLVTGGNRSGKTGLLDAIQLLGTGQHPTAGIGGRPAKKTADVLHLASGSELFISGNVQTDRGPAFVSRAWEQVVKGDTISHPKRSDAATVSGKTINPKHADAAIVSMLGDLHFIDASALLSASAKKRTEMIFDFVGAAPWSHDELWKRAEDLGLTVEQIEAVWATKTARNQSRAFALCKDWDGVSSLNAWLKDQAEFMSTIAKKEHAALTRLRKAMELYSSEQHPEFDEDARQAARRALAEAEEHYHAAGVTWTEKLRVANEAVARERKLADDIRIAQIQLGKAQAKMKALQERDPAAEIAGLKAKAEEQHHKGEVLEADADRLRAELDVQNRKIAALEQQIEAADKERVDLAASVDRGTIWLRDLEVDLSRTTAELETRLRSLNDAIRAMESGFCPTCPSVHCFHDQSVVQALRAQADEASAKLAAETDLASRKRFKGGANHERNQQDLRDMDEQMRSIRSSITFLRHSGLDRKIEEAQRAASQARACARLLERQLHEAQSNAASGWQRETEDLERRIAELTTQASGTANVMGAEFDQSVIADQRSAAEVEAKARVDAARAKVDEIASETDALRKHRRNEADAIDAKEAWQAAKLAAKVLGPAGLQAQLLKTSMAPMVGPVNEIINGLGIGTFGVLDTDDQGKEGLWPGLRHDDGSWSHIETMSGSEKVIMSAAVLFGLASMGGAPWKPLLVDGIEQLEKNLRKRFLAHVADLVERGIVDQAIVTGCPDTVEVGDGWTVVEMSR